MDKLLEKMKRALDRPTSAIEIVRKAVVEADARATKPDQPDLLNTEQLTYFHKYREYLPGFLETENGKDAIYLLCDGFAAYVEECQAYAAHSTLVTPEALTMPPP